MKAAGAVRWTVAAAVLTAMLASALSFRATAQSEYMRGDRMPYDAFDRLPRTDLEVPGGTIHVAFAPGDITLPNEKLLDWIRMSSRPITDGFPLPRCGCYWCPSMAGASAAARRGAIAAPPFAFRSAAIPPRMSCSATG
jgi:hypothetical protein